MNPAKCDSKGNIYFRRYQYPSALVVPIVKVSPDGRETTVFSLDSVPGFKQADIDDFAVGPRGDIFLLVTKCEADDCEIDLLIFKEDGSYQDKIKTDVDSSYLVSRLGVFASGEFILVGWKEKEPEPMDAEPTSPGDTSSGWEPYTGIVDQSGRLLAEVTLTGDVKAQTSENAENQAVHSPSVISLGAVVSGEDGNLYLMRRTPKPIVFAISRDGSLVRHFEVTPPSENARALAMKFGSGNRLIFEFAEKLEERRYATERAIFSLVDLETGERLLDYQSAPGVGGIFACYAPNTFTFLNATKDGRLAIRHAVPR